ncbi:hypothetical protein [Pseudalkalibacillus caeni]|uniref:hypothetical protein n=1 Tax=Exobacillus caeni TaxID=2574798 RepID=UPI00148592FD|nr:hypothetical protein [Pseudalkalibacillus caeni]
MRTMQISKELLDYVADADLHTKLDGVEHSTNLRDIVTVGYMVENAQEERQLALPR